MIFVVVALAWAGYLIPKALKRHDDLALSRPVQTFSDSVRVVGRGSAPAARSDLEPPASPVLDAPLPRPRVQHTVTRESARRAARRRRRVLTGLLAALVLVAGAAFLSVVPTWTPTVPGGLIVLFLIVARLSVRAQQRAIGPVPAPSAAAGERAVDVLDLPGAETEGGTEADLGPEDTVGIDAAQIAEAVGEPVLDEAGLWDPLPVTLPTYVNKARARRTVRTIEITAMTSSGHDAADTALARQAAEAAEAETEQSEIEETADRKAAGA